MRQETFTLSQKELQRVQELPTDPHSIRNAANSLTSRRWPFLDNTHGHARYPADDFGLRRIIEPAYVLVGLRVRNNHQLSAIDLTPTTSVARSEFHEVNRAIEFCCPFFGADFPLASVDLHQRTRADQRVERIILEADVSIDGFAEVEMLQQTHGDLVPFLYDAGKEIRLL